MLVHGSAEPEGNGRPVEHIAVSGTGLEIERFPTRADP